MADSGRKVFKRRPRGLRLAVMKVLQDSNKPMSPSEIWAEVRRRELHTSRGKTPEATVSAILYTRSDEFERIGRGRFRLRSGSQMQG